MNARSRDIRDIVVRRLLPRSRQPPWLKTSLADLWVAHIASDLIGIGMVDRLPMHCSPPPMPLAFFGYAFFIDVHR